MKNKAKKPDFVVGIGASAGGLKAFQELLPGLPVGKNIAYLFLQHSMEHESTLEEVLKDLSPFPLSMAKDKQPIEGDTLYICPPGIQCEVKDGCVQLKNIEHEGPRHTVDVLFSSLASQYPDHCAGIILSGTGRDGTEGLQDIKTAGGWTLIQDPATAEYDSMPKQAIDIYLADFVRPAAEIGPELAEITQLWKAKGSVSIGDQDKLHMLLEILENNSGFNFHRYKEAMLLRRIRRRMVANKLNTIGEYILLVQKSTDEVKYLTKEMFITVTGFFRDEKVFQRLRQLLKKIIEEKKPGDSIRIWSAGCATGEEAYSVALLLAELQKNLTQPLDVRIFATDIDPDNIDFARKGIYSAKAVEHIPTPLLQHYFDKVEGNYQISGELRDLVVFAVHDVSQDTAFSRMDLICCRNLLIYFNRSTQARLLSRFHYSLKPDGYLLLGSSERTSTTEKLFKVVDRQNTLYMRRDVKNRPAIFPAEQSPRLPVPEKNTAHIPWQQQAWEIYFNEYAPAAVLLNDRLELMHVHGKVNAYLSLPEGNFNVNILHMAKQELKIDLQMVLQQAQRSGALVRSRPIKLPSGARETGEVLVTMVAIPQQGAPEIEKNQREILLVFEESPLPKHTKITSDTDVDGKSSLHIKALEEELAVTREQLQANIEALEAANQELQSVNEEFHSTLEELQSSNEEFQTANEELESTNEELISVNDELKTKSQELERANEELDTIFNTVLAGIIMLDADLQVTRYSDSCRDLFKLWPNEVSNIQQLMFRLDGLTTISKYVQQTLKTGRSCQLEAELDSRFFVIRLIPITETGTRDVRSLVIAFHDETEREASAREAELLATIVKSSDDAIIVQGLKGDIRAWNDGATRMFGYSEKQALTINIRDLIARGQKKAYTTYIDNIVKGGNQHSTETTAVTRNGNILDIWSSTSILKDRNGEIDGVAIIIRDVSEKNANENKLNAVMESIPDPFIIIGEQGKINRVNRQAENLFGYKRHELTDQHFNLLIPGHFHKKHNLYHREFLSNPVMRKMGKGGELTCLTKNGKELPVDISLSPIIGIHETSIMIRFRDIRPERKEKAALQRVIHNADEANRTKTRFLAAASHDLRQPLQSISMYLGTLTGNVKVSEKTRILGQIRMAVDTSNKLLNALLNMSKLESGKIEPQIETFEINRLLERVQNTEAPQALGKNQNFSMIPCAVHVKSDPVLLEQLVTNLVANAIKYSPPYSHIVLGCRRNKTHLKIQVVDNGPGIKSTQLDTIFDEYRQLDHEGHYLGKGLGLGLSIVKLIADLLNLKLEVSSKPGKGSSFYVLVPTAQSKSKRKTKLRALPKSQKPNKNIKLLLIEDDTAVLDSTKLFLEVSGFTVITARDTREALAVLDNNRPAVIITDYGLDQKDNGIELIQILRKKLNKQLPAIVITGYTSELRGREAKAADCEIISKPIEAERLLQILSNLMQKN